MSDVKIKDLRDFVATYPSDTVINVMSTENCLAARWAKQKFGWSTVNVSFAFVGENAANRTLSLPRSFAGFLEDLVDGIGKGEDVGYPYDDNGLYMTAAQLFDELDTLSEDPVTQILAKIQEQDYKLAA